jgi:hypothetical protein
MISSRTLSFENRPKKEPGTLKSRFRVPFVFLALPASRSLCKKDSLSFALPEKLGNHSWTRVVQPNESCTRAETLQSDDWGGTYLPERILLKKTDAIICLLVLVRSFRVFVASFPWCGLIGEPARSRCRKPAYTAMPYSGTS